MTTNTDMILQGTPGQDPDKSIMMSLREDSPNAHTPTQIMPSAYCKHAETVCHGCVDSWALDWHIHYDETAGGRKFLSDHREMTPLARVYTLTVSSDQVTDDESDIAADRAIDCIAAAGFDADDSDHLGAAMGDDVQTLLQLAFIRCPELMDLFNA